MAELTQLIKQNRFKAAENLLRKKLEQEPENVYFLAQLANALWNLNKDEEALTYADKAKSISPTYPLTLFTRARVLGLEEFTSVPLIVSPPPQALSTSVPASTMVAQVAILRVFVEVVFIVASLR